jgi:hypothetical protein
VVLTDGTARCWGYNATGALGAGPYDSTHPSPDIQPATRRLVGTVADLSLTATPLGATALHPGQTTQIQLTLRNNGPDSANPTVQVRRNDGLPVTSTSSLTGAVNEVDGTTTWTPTTLANGGATTLTVTVRADSVGVHPVTAQVATSDAGDPDSTPGDDLGPDDLTSTPITVTTAPVTPDRLTLTATRHGHTVSATAMLLVTRAALRDACTGRATLHIRDGRKTKTLASPLKLRADGTCRATFTVKSAAGDTLKLTVTTPLTALLLPASSRQVTIRIT